MNFKIKDFTMNNNNTNRQILQSLSRYVQALYNDGSNFWADDESLATPERKALILSDIALIEAQLTAITNALNDESASEA